MKNYRERFLVFFLGCFVFVNSLGIFTDNLKFFTTLLTAIGIFALCAVGIENLLRRRDLTTTLWVCLFGFSPLVCMAFASTREWIPCIGLLLVSSFIVAWLESTVNCATERISSTETHIHIIDFFVFQLLVALSIYSAAIIPWWGNLICAVVPITLLVYADTKKTTQIANRILSG